MPPAEYPSTDPPAGADVWTVGRIIDWTTGHLKKSGSDTPRLDAEILLAHARKCSRIKLYVDYATPLTDSQRGAMRDLVRRRAQAEPVAYLVGHREFFGLDFRVTPDVLIPRPETETLVLETLTAAKKIGGEGSRDAKRSPPRILDVGTGSGCIAIACAVSLPQSQVTAIDISPPALALARLNAQTHKVADRIRFLEGDLLKPLAANEQFDLIASNPPYVADDEMAGLPPDVGRHEPHLALRAGPHGLDVIRRLVASAAPHLVPTGRLLIEISPEQAPAVFELLASQGAYQPATTVKDPSGRLRVVTAQRK